MSRTPRSQRRNRAIRDEKRVEGDIRNIEWRALSKVYQMKSLDRRLGVGVGAKRQVKFQKRHYEAIATVLQKEWQTHAHLSPQRETLLSIVFSLADAFRDDNPGFKRWIFLENCHVHPHKP